MYVCMPYSNFTILTKMERQIKNTTDILHHELEPMFRIFAKGIHHRTIFMRFQTILREYLCNLSCFCNVTTTSTTLLSALKLLLTKSKMSKKGYCIAIFFLHYSVYKIIRSKTFIWGGVPIVLEHVKRI